MKSVARHLRSWRGERDLTQGKLARRAEALLPDGRTMSHSRYWQIENGEGSEPSDEEKSAIARALDVRIGDINWPRPVRETEKAS